MGVLCHLDTFEIMSYNYLETLITFLVLFFKRKHFPTLKLDLETYTKAF